jgi:hypothetical protein
MPPRSSHPPKPPPKPTSSCSAPLPPPRNPNGLEVRFKKYGCCPHPYASISFYLHMQRESLFYTMNLVIPAVMIAVLGVACFAVPWDGGERVTLMVTTLLTLTVYTVLVIENLPFGGNTPFLAKFIMMLWCFAYGVFLLGT